MIHKLVNEPNLAGQPSPLAGNASVAQSSRGSVTLPLKTPIDVSISVYLEY